MSTDSKKTNKKKSTKKPTVKKIDKQREKFTILTQEYAALEDRQLRLKAEFENYRKRKERETVSLIEYLGEDIIKDLLPILDDFDRMILSTTKTKKGNADSLLEGTKLIQSKLNKLLKSNNIVAFGKPGDILDPELHDALMVKQKKGKKDNEILDVFEKGYRYKDRVIRHAKVVVNGS